MAARTLSESSSACGRFCKFLCTDARLDYTMDVDKWREHFAYPGGLVGGCHWMHPNVYLGFRATLFVTWFACIIWSMADSNGIGYWFTQLTHLGGLLELVYFGFAAYTTYMAIFSDESDGEKAPWYVGVTWALSSGTVVMCTMIFTLYWALVYEPGPGKPHAISVVMHGGNFVFILADLLLTRQPYYFRHIYMPFLMSTAYLLFTAVYYLAGGTNSDGEPFIYSSLDWRKTGAASKLAALILLVAVPIVYTLTFALAAIRVKCRECAEGQGNKIFQDEPEPTKLGA